MITTDIILSTETVPVENVTGDFLVSESLTVSAEESETPLIKLQENHFFIWNLTCFFVE